jgi:hypothetical protein
MSVLVTLDFDGVISPYEPCEPAGAEWTPFRLGGFDLHIRREVLDFLQWLAASPATPVWASSWGHITQAFATDTRGAIPDFPHLLIGHAASKTDAIMAAANDAFGTVVVVDDDRTVGASIRRRLGERAILVTPRDHYGLTDRQIATIRRAVVDSR